MSMTAERAALGAENEVREAPSRWKAVLRQMLGTKRVIVGLVLLALLAAIAWLGPLFSPWAPNERDYANFLQPPSAEHWFGTDNTGRDMFAMTMVGLQKSLLVGLLVALLSTAIASIVGAFAGYFGGMTDKSLMWIADLGLVLPNFIILAILAKFFVGESGWVVLVVLLAVFSWMVTSKMIRGMTISLKEREYIHAARFMGVPPWKIIFRHVLPNMSSLIIVDATIMVSAAIIAETGLSYFGLGIQPPDVSLGTLIAYGSRQAVTHPWTFVFATTLLVVLVLAVNMIGDGLRDALDPQSKSRRS